MMSNSNLEQFTLIRDSPQSKSHSMFISIRNTLFIKNMCKEMWSDAIFTIFDHTPQQQNQIPKNCRCLLVESV